ncbi:hypothetical protein BKA64DRAFT_74400 [Cadophora sp. MPI-SDFR-AT-0126]|nr:hypothetical protein BKA64DRAFT_74400 [Leotiomycetes sp. MPI-SDFR-AT-0126]
MDPQNPGSDRTSPTPVPTAAPSPFKCNVCQRSYSRVDHLARHFRTHTAEKAYRCDVCSKSFTRADLLKRHASAHTDSRRNRRSHQPRAGRVSQACKACAGAKLKCKEEKPCQRCVSKGIRCDYNEQEHRSVESWRGGSIDDSFTQGNGGGMTDVVRANAMDYDSGNGAELEDWMLGNAQNVHGQVGSSSMDHMSGMLPADPNADVMMEVNDNLFADFLRDIMMPPQSGPYNGQIHVDGVDTPSIAFRDLFSFGQDSNLELNNQDYTLMDFYQGKTIAEPPPPRPPNPTSVSFQAQTPQSEATNQPNSESLALGTEAFKRSLWCWTPVRQDAGHQEQSNFNLQPEDAPNLGTQFVVSEQVAAKVFGPEARDKIVAMILSTCDRKNFSKVMSSFPSAELLNSLMQCFLASHIAQNDTWIHLPTLKIGKLRPELLASFLAAGAMFSSSLTIRKLGFAIQEAVRFSVPKVCEENNSVTRDLTLLQGFVLSLDVGLWSGNKRKIELAESQALVVVTMCRRASRMLRSNYQTIRPLESDTGKVLDQKWRAWAEQESLKRLIFHLFIRDAQTSMCLVVPTIISYSELTLPLPLPNALFLAPTAAAWKALYPSQTLTNRVPSLPQCLYDLSPLNAAGAHRHLDIPLCLSLVAYGMWGLILEFRTLNSVLRAHPTPDQSYGSNTLVIGHRHQELCQLLQHFTVSLPSAVVHNRQAAPVPTTTLESRILASLLLTHLHVSFNDIQLFAGREGDEEARRVYPGLQTWVESREARTALWHAGQVVRYAKMLGAVREFFAVAVYHASLTFWAYGVLRLGGERMNNVDHSSGDENLLVWLDGDEVEDVKRFVALGSGMPCFSAAGKVARLSEPEKVMNAIINVLKGVDDNGSTKDEQTVIPPLVENLSQLITELGSAARAVMSN